jgi:hypothetical protein
MGDRFLEHEAGLAQERLSLGLVESISRALGMETGTKHNLGGVDIADTGQVALVHEKVLQGRAMGGEELLQAAVSEAVFQGVEAETAFAPEDIVEIGGGDQAGIAEAPGVAIDEPAAVVELPDHAGVGGELVLGGPRVHLAGHAEALHHGVAGGEFEQQDLAAAAGRLQDGVSCYAAEKLAGLFVGDERIIGARPEDAVPNHTVL